MQNESITSNKNLLKKLKRKAELCRYCHSELKESYKAFRNWKEFIIVLLSVVSSLLIGFYYREMLQGEWVLLVIFIIPSSIIIVQALDSTVFRWTEKMTKYETAIQIWGHWVREADFIEKQICLDSVGVASEKIKNIQGKYNNCMNNTPQIPNSKFLKYKKCFREYVLESKMIDTMTLDVIKAEKHARK